MKGQTSFTLWGQIKMHSDYCKEMDMAPSNNSNSIFFPGKQTWRVKKQELKYDIRIRNTKFVIRVRVLLTVTNLSDNLK